MAVEPTHEMLCRSQPNLLDLLVAVTVKYKQPLEVYAWFRYDAVVTPDGYTSFHDFIKAPMRYNEQQWKEKN